VKRLTSEPGYDAECVVSRTDGRIVFCSLRTGDPELFSMNGDGSGLKQLTSEKGYDGGPFVSVDGKRIIWRTYQPKTPEQIARYEELIGRNAVGRWPLDIWIMNIDGTDKKRLTTRGEKTGNTCWAPYLHPNNRHVIFVSTTGPRGRGRPNFDLHLLDIETGKIERVTHDPGFDGFPMFSDDGRKLVFGSSRSAAKRGEVGIFIADWKP
jgi:Tol biopolymer transport system component